MSMPRTTLTRASWRSLFAGVAILAPMALVIELSLAAFSTSSSAASPAHAAMQSIIIRASAPRLSKKITAGLVSVTLVNDTKAEATADFGSVNPGATVAQIKAADAAAQNSPQGFFSLLKHLAAGKVTFQL